MTKSTSIRPSAATLVVGARVLLRNGVTAAVTSVMDGGVYPVSTTAGRYTLCGRYLISERTAYDIIEVLPKEAADIVNLSKLKAGDIIVFKSGRTAEAIKAAERRPDSCFHVRFQYLNGSTDYWNYEQDGSWAGYLDSEHTIVKVIPKERPAVDVSKVTVGDTLEFVNGETAVVTKARAPVVSLYELHFRMANGDTDYWGYTHDGRVGGSQSHRHTIVEHIPKITPAPQGDTPASPVPNPVSHPSHYTSHPSGVECIQVTQHMTFNLGNVVKYVWRNGLKDSGGDDLQDLKKAQWYLNKEIERLEATAA